MPTSGVCSYYVVLPLSLLPPDGMRQFTQFTKFEPTWRPAILVNECFQALDAVGPSLDALHGLVRPLRRAEDKKASQIAMTPVLHAMKAWWWLSPSSCP